MEFAFTITIQPKLYRLKLRSQYIRSIHFFNKIFEDREDWRVIEVHPECTKALNIHIHGIIQYHGKVQAYYTPEMRFKDLFRGHEFFGFNNIQQITDYAGWKEYITKDQNNPITKHVVDTYFLYYWTYEEPIKGNIEDKEVLPIQLSPLDDGIQNIEK